MYFPGMAVRCRNLHKEFGHGESTVLALRGVDLDVRLGEMTFLVGPSGSGKTTLLSVIAGLLDSSGGDVEVLGEWLEQLPSQQRIRFRRTRGTHDKKPDETRYPGYGDRRPGVRAGFGSELT